MLKEAIIKQQGDNWVLMSHDGSKVLGHHPSREAALKQERAIQMHKHSSLIEDVATRVMEKLATYEKQKIVDSILTSEHRPVSPRNDAAKQKPWQRNPNLVGKMDLIDNITNNLTKDVKNNPQATPEQVINSYPKDHKIEFNAPKGMNSETPGVAENATDIHMYNPLHDYVKGYFDKFR